VEGIMRGWRLGRIAGIDVEIHFTWVIIFVLVLVSLSTAALPHVPASLPSVVRWIGGLVATVLFFASLLVHELSHSLMARREGIPVRRITLFIFGGVAQIASEPRSPGAELRIAVVGPLTSAVLGAVFIKLASLVPTTHGGLALLHSNLFYLGAFNLVIAAFNSLPAFPLDGGRILRSLLWLWWKDLRRATGVAAGLGKVLGYGLAGVGLWEMVARGEVAAGLWRVALGWLLAAVAEQEYQRASAMARLGGLRVADFMSSPPITVPADMDLEQFAHAYEFMLRHGAYPVVSEGRVKGMLEREVLRATPRHLWPVTTVAAVMQPLEAPEMVIEADAPLDEVLSRLTDTGRSRLLVVNERGELVGIISHSDVLRALRSFRRLA
jgi:Zn-dependent protease